jgi:hypothetical protein
MLCLKLSSSCANRACNSLCCLRTATISSARSVGLRVFRARWSALKFHTPSCGRHAPRAGCSFSARTGGAAQRLPGQFCLCLAEACNLLRLRFPQIRDILPQSTERLLKRLARLSERPGLARHPWQRYLEETKRLLSLQILFRKVAGAISPRRRPH